LFQIYVEKNLCGENICGEKMTNMRSGDFVKLCTTRHIWLVASYHKHGKKANRSNKDVLELTLKWHGLIATELFCKGEEQETQEEGEWDCLDFWR